MTTTNQVAIEATGLVKKYGNTTALAGVDLSVPTGTVLGVLGPNGAGKTTAVRILGTLLRPDAGHATVGGYDVVRDAGKVRGIIGLTGQYASVDEDMSGRRNLVMIGRLLGYSREQSRARAVELLLECETPLRPLAVRAAYELMLKWVEGFRKRHPEFRGKPIGEKPFTRGCELKTVLFPASAPSETKPVPMFVLSLFWPDDNRPCEARFEWVKGAWVVTNCERT